MAESMTMDLSQADHDLLDTYLNAVLDGYRGGSLTLVEARSTLAEAFTQAADDNQNITIYMRHMIESGGRADR